MHHTLRFYSHNRERFLRYYIFQAKWTRVPLIGRFVRWVGNRYGETSHGAILLTPEEARQLVDLSPEVLVGPCACRHEFHNCKNPVEAEIMLGRDNPFVAGRPQDYRTSAAKRRKRCWMTAAAGDCGHGHQMPRELLCHLQLLFMLLRTHAVAQDYGIGSALVRNPNIVAEFQAWLAGVPREGAGTAGCSR